MLVPRQITWSCRLSCEVLLEWGTRHARRAESAILEKTLSRGWALGSCKHSLPSEGGDCVSRGRKGSEQAAERQAEV